MIINRYNYEEYFLLYTDNELGDAERKAVESFVEENPDLKNELLGFRDAVMHADEAVKFPGQKELLSSNAALSVIHNNNYTEFFLLYADNELNNQEKALVEQYVYHHPELQGEFELFLKVKIEPDRTIVFENKELLIRRQEKARVIAVWWKISASVAAALIFIVFGYLNYNADNEAAPAPLLSQKTNAGINSQKKKTPLIVIPNEVTSQVVPDTADQIVVAEQHVQTPAAPGEHHGKTTDIANSATSKEIMPTKKAKSLPETNAEKPSKEKVTDKVPVAGPREIQVAELPAGTTNVLAISTDHAQPLHPENLQLKTAANITAAPDERQESALSIAGIPVPSKSKVGNIISRTSRFINKTKKEISSKAGLAIGNVEIAIR
ncbi:MAG: hypothetical protein ABI151_02490 [Chitinophagaceae bacterium]